MAGLLEGLTHRMHFDEVGATRHADRGSGGDDDQVAIMQVAAFGGGIDRIDDHLIRIGGHVDQ